MDFSTFKNKYKITGALEVITALHIGSGKEEDEHDSPFIYMEKDKKNKKFYIPGSSFRGYLRTKLERYLDENNDFKFFIKEKDKKIKLNSADVKLIFGYTNLDKEVDSKIERVKNYFKLRTNDDYKKNYNSFAGKIHISDMPIREYKESIKRDGIVISRDTGATKTGGKFDYDVLSEGTKFEFTLELENIEEFQLDLIALSLEDILDENGDLFGGMQARGIGRCKLSIDKIEYVDKMNLKEYIFSKKMKEKNLKEFLEIKNLDLKVD